MVHKHSTQQDIFVSRNNLQIFLFHYMYHNKEKENITLTYNSWP